MAESPDAATLTVTTQQLNAIVQSAVKGVLSTQQHKCQLPRPTIDLESSDNRWAFFLNKWKLYKTECRLPDSAPSELRPACSTDLKLRLYEFIGDSIDTLDETALLEKIKQIAVRSKNVAVHRQEFFNTRQSEGESTQQFYSRLRSKADQCDFNIKCKSSLCSNTLNSYSSAMVDDILTVGCYDEDVQCELLARSAQFKNVEEKYQFIEAMESGKRARGDLSGHSSITAQKSAYKVLKKQPPPRTDSLICEGCGSDEHGPGTDKPRKQNCPARTVQCVYCHIVGHFGRVCRKKTAAKIIKHP